MQPTTLLRSQPSQTASTALAHQAKQPAHQPPSATDAQQPLALNELAPTEDRASVVKQRSVKVPRAELMGPSQACNFIEPDRSR